MSSGKDVVYTLRASSVCCWFVVGAEFSLEKVGKVVLRDDALDALHVCANVFVEILANDDLVFVVKFGVEELIKCKTELSARILVAHAILFELEDVLLMDGGDSCGARVFRRLIGGEDCDPFAKMAKQGDKTESSEWVRALVEDAARCIACTC
jgi:hypothetical protein